MIHAIPWTLQRYIFREMGKTFFLSSLALTVVLSLGGGVLEMIKLGEVTPGQLMRLLGLLLPVAMALTLPIAALFSAAATYGRLSADNEFVACRSSGINIHVLFLPSLAMSVVSATVTFVFINFLIPGMVRNLNEFLGGNIATFIEHRLKKPRGISLGKRHRVYADSSSTDATGQERVTLHGAAYVEIDGAEWVRYGTAGEVELQFERDDRRIRAAGVMSDVSFFDRREGRFADVDRQAIDTSDLPTMLPQQIKFLTLPELLHYYRHPLEWHEAGTAISKLRSDLGRHWVSADLWRQWKDSGQILVGDDRRTLTMRAKSARWIEKDGSIELQDVRIDESVKGAVQRTYDAARATVEVTKGDSFSECGIRIEAFEVRIRGAGGVVERAKETLGPLAIATQWVQKVEGLTEDELLRAEASGDGDPLKERREAAEKSIGGTARRIAATVVERFAFSGSVLVLVLLGAALGIIFRGAHVVVAFGISFVPSLLVIVSIVMGKQLAHNAGTHAVGILLMVAGLVLVALLDTWTLTRVLRR